MTEVTVHAAALRHEPARVARAYAEIAATA
jgi:hypothetical protein